MFETCLLERLPGVDREALDKQRTLANLQICKTILAGTEATFDGNPPLLLRSPGKFSLHICLFRADSQSYPQDLTRGGLMNP